MANGAVATRARPPGQRNGCSPTHGEDSGTTGSPTSPRLEGYSGTLNTRRAKAAMVCSKVSGGTCVVGAENLSGLGAGEEGHSEGGFEDVEHEGRGGRLLNACRDVGSRCEWVPGFERGAVRP